MKNVCLAFFFVVGLLGCANSMHSRYMKSINESYFYMEIDRTLELSKCLDSWRDGVDWFRNEYSKLNRLLKSDNYMLIERVSPTYNGYGFFYIEKTSGGYPVHTNFIDNNIVTKNLERSDLLGPLLNVLEGLAISQRYMDTEWDDGVCYFVTIKNGGSRSIYAYYSPPDILNLKEADDVGSLIQSSELTAENITLGTKR